MRKVLMLSMFRRTRRDIKNVMILYMQRVSSVQWKKYQCRSYHNFGHCTSLCYQKKQVSFKPRKPKAFMLQVGAVYAWDKSICHHPEDLSSSDDSFCLQVKIQHTQSDCKNIPTPSHLITNLAYRLKPHDTRNQYLRVRLDTCVDENIMPVSVYKLVFNDTDLKKLAPSTLEIGTYTTDTAKIVGFCVFYLVHLDTKKLHEVTFLLLCMMEVSCYHVQQHLCLH